MNNSQIGERIKAERKRLDLTQVEAGRLCDVTRETWGKYERGLFEIGFATLRAFVAAGADLDFIATGIPKSAFERVIATTIPAHMKEGSEGKEASLLRNYRLLQEPLQDAVSALVEIMANLRQEEP